jgi:hypothetical protein
MRINKQQTAKTGFGLIYIYSEFFGKIISFLIYPDPFLGIIESLEMRFLKSCNYDFASFIVWNKFVNKET